MSYHCSKCGYAPAPPRNCASCGEMGCMAPRETLLDAQAALKQERQDVRRLEVSLLALRSAARLVELSSREYFREYGWQHEVDCCPADETCRCEPGSRFSAALSELFEVANRSRK